MPLEAIVFIINPEEHATHSTAKYIPWCVCERLFNFNVNDLSLD
jgi:hypothetical protein